MTRNAPDLGLSSKIHFRISEELVDRFAAITGDASSLHVDQGFARRSQYRRPVVHGMLPVGLLALVPALHLEGLSCVLRALTGRFVAPVFCGDALTLTVDSGRPGQSPGEIVYDYRIQHETSGAIATNGTLTVTFRAVAAPVLRRGGAAPMSGMLVQAPAMNSFRLEDLAIGLDERVDFRICDETLGDFLRTIAAALSEQPAIDLPAVASRFYLPNLMTMLLFSTSVGVCVPGASATFLEFSAECPRDIEVAEGYSLRGTVAHISKATRIVKKNLVVQRVDREAPVLHGKVAALVNKPPQSMPTMGELKASAMDWGLAGKVVLVTGASRGIGETTAKLFALYGAKVIVNYHRGAYDAARIVKEIADAGGDAMAIGADITQADEVAELVRRAVERYGPPDVLVNNAVRDFRPMPFLSLSWEEVQKDLDVIAKGAFLCCQHTIPFMLERGGGKIINISSVATDNPPPNQTKYVMAKSALVGLTRSLSIEFASKNILVNLVVPNFVETDLVTHIQQGFRKKMADETPLRRHATPIDVARAVIMLASSQSSFTTGQKIMVTGGGAPYA